MADGGEWSQVKNKRGRGRKFAVENPKDELMGTKPNENPQFSVDDMQNYHEIVQRDWFASDCWKELHQILSDATSKPNRPLIDKAICLGPGPYDPSNGSSLVRRTAHMQTVAFESIVTALESCTGQKIKTIIQEPGFTSVDKAYCTRKGFDVVQTPEAFSMVDGNTLVFGIHMELQTYTQALVTLPAIFVGAGLDEWEKLIDFRPDLEGIDPIRQMDNTYDKFTFPDLDYMFYGTTIYWKKDNASALSEKSDR